MFQKMDFAWSVLNIKLVIRAKTVLHILVRNLIAHIGIKSQKMENAINVLNLK